MQSLRHKNFKDISVLFHENVGSGYAVGDEKDNVDDIVGIGELIFSQSETNGIAVYRHADGLTLVGDIHGPWAVDVGFGQLATMGH